MISPMKRAALALVLAACSTSSSNDFPPLPGTGGGGVIVGGGGSGGTTGDAGVGDGAGDGGTPLTGRVCLVTDLRTPTATCDATKAGGLTVTLGTAGAPGTATTTTAADGSFTIAAPLGAGFTWHVTGGVNLVPSVMLFGTETTIPAMLIDDYNNALLTIGLEAVDEGHGSVVVRAVNGLAPALGITAKLSPLADSDTFYDTDGSPKSPVWNNTSTQSTGVIWVPGVQLPGPVAITLGRTDGTTVPASATVERQSITFVTQDVQ
jgi:hypothetical protein